MNKNDLRFIKTEDIIISTYEEMLRTNKKGMNVTQLCKTARINTSTFIRTILISKIYTLLYAENVWKNF